MRVYVALRDQGNVLCVDAENKFIVKETGNKDGPSKIYSFDEAFASDATVDEIFHATLRPLLMYALDGATSTFYAYGQTGVGKSFLMHGHPDTSSDENTSANHYGLIGQCIEQLYEFVSKRPDSYVIKASYMEVKANDDFVDLLDPCPASTECKLRQCCENFDGSRYVDIEGLIQVTVSSKKELWGVYEKGKANRTMMKKSIDGDVEYQSSRSHTIFQICVQHSEEGSGEDGSVLLGSAGTITTGYLNMVDLMGVHEESEFSGADQINIGLNALHEVVYRLADNGSSPARRNDEASPSSPTKKHIPFRNSILTRILKPSFQDHSLVVTSILCLTSTLESHFKDTLQILRFSQACKQLKMRKMDVLEYEEITEKMMKEIERLRQQLDASGSRVRHNSGNVDGNDIDLEYVNTLVQENNELKKLLKELNAQAIRANDFREMELDLAQQRRELAMARENFNEEKHNFIEEKKNFRADMDILSRKEEKLEKIHGSIDEKESEILVRIDSIKAQKALWDDTIKDLVRREEMIKQSLCLLEGKEKTLNGIKSEISKKQKTLVGREHELTQKETEVKIQLENIKKMENDIKLWEDNLQIKMSEMDDKEKKLSQSLVELKERDEKLQECDRLLERERAELTNAKKLLNSKEESLQHQQKQLYEGEEKLKSSSISIESRNIELNSHLTEAKKLAHKSNVIIEKYHAEVVRLGEMRKKLEMQLESCHRWEEELNDKDADLTLLENSLRSRDTALSDLEREREEFREERRSVKSEEDKFKAEMYFIARRHSKQMEDFELFVTEILGDLKNKYCGLHEQRKKAMTDSDDFRKDHTVALKLFRRDTSDLMQTDMVNDYSDASKLNEELYVLSCKMRNLIEENATITPPSSSSPSRRASLPSFSIHQMDDLSTIVTKDNPSRYKSNFEFDENIANNTATPGLQSTLNGQLKKSTTAHTLLSRQQDQSNSHRRHSMLSFHPPPTALSIDTRDVLDAPSIQTKSDSSISDSDEISPTNIQSMSPRASFTRLSSTYEDQDTKKDTPSSLSAIFLAPDDERSQRNDVNKSTKKKLSEDDISDVRGEDFKFSGDMDRIGNKVQPSGVNETNTQDDDDDSDERKLPVYESTPRRSKVSRQQKEGSLFMSNKGNSSLRRNDVSDQSDMNPSIRDQKAARFTESFRQILENRPISSRSRRSSIGSVQSSLDDDASSERANPRLTTATLMGQDSKRVSFSDD